MLAEHFIASIGAPTKAQGTSVSKDAGIFLHEYQPMATQRAVFKKSATPPNCLAVSDTHIYAAQAEKAVVHVYSRDKGNQEATVPFTERITCLTLACANAVLILGTAEGRILLWEVATGRQVTTAQSHLQAVKSLVVDAASNFLISASADSTCHVWSLPALLAFSNAGLPSLAPLRTFSIHRSKVEALAIGHSESFQNIAISAAQDKTCLIWDYHTNAVLRTYLLPATPTSIALDGADRAFFVGYSDGSIQRIDLFQVSNAAAGGLHGASEQAAPIQPKGSIWSPSDAKSGSALALDVSFDGTTLLSGHQSGDLLAWDIATGHMKPALAQGPLPGPVTDVRFLPVSGYQYAIARPIRLETVVKPKFGVFQESTSGDGAVPGNYALNVHISAAFSQSLEFDASVFQQAIFAPNLPLNFLDEGLEELASWGHGHTALSNSVADEPTDDFMALDEPAQSSDSYDLQQQNTDLKAQLEALRRVQSASFEKLETLQAELKASRKREQARMIQLAQKDKRKGINGASQEEASASESDDSDDAESNGSD